MTYEFIKANKEKYSIRTMSKMLSISKSSYYDFVKNLDGPTRRREIKNREILTRIQEIFKESRGRYGSPRISHKLRKEGIKASKNKIARIMRANSIAVKYRHKRKYSKQKGTEKGIDLIERQFNPVNRNRLWGSDITYIKTQQGWKYLVVIMDLYSRMIIAWRVNNTQDEKLIINAIENAISNRKPNNNNTDKILIFHSDRGSQYKSLTVKGILENQRIIQSMGGKGSCYDNAVLESFFSTLKKELIYNERYLGIEDLRKSLFEYIEIFYNRKRMHSTLGYLTPFEFETKNVIF